MAPPPYPLPESGEGDFCAVWVYPGTGGGALSPGLYIRAAEPPIQNSECRMQNAECRIGMLWLAYSQQLVVADYTGLRSLQATFTLC